jgi:signal transduction histidine kinase
MGLPGELVELYDTTLERVAATGDTLRGSLEGAFDKTLSFTLGPEPDEAGAVASVLAIFRDVTEIVAAEKAKGEVERRLLHAQKLESLEALAGGIAHDFNNILTVLSGNVELLQLILGEEHEGAEEVTAILDAVRRAGGLTRQMLHFSGGADITLDIIDLGEVVRGVEEDLRAAVPPQVALEIRSPDEPLRVRGGVDSLRQVLVNLVSNGAEAVGDGEGRVSVVLSPIRPDAGAGVPKAVIAAPDFDPSGPLASIEVRDDGAGMSPSVLARIFEPFFSTKFEGRGLGLAAVQGIVHAHGGALAVESAPGTGSTFRLFLPCEEPEVSSTGTGAGAVPAGAQLRVLVVDDEAPVRQLLRVFLLRGGHRVSTAADGREALDHLAAEVADLVFLDMTMPHMGGAECLRRIRARWPELAVVMMSGLAAERVTQELGGERLPVLQKPFSLRAVARVTDAVIESVRSGS